MLGEVLIFLRLRLRPFFVPKNSKNNQILKLNGENIMKTIINYGNGLIEQKEYIKKEFPITTFKPLPNNQVINTQTGEVKEKRMPKTKLESKNAPKALIEDGRKMLFNLLPNISSGKAYFVTLCCDSKCDDKDNFKYEVSKYVKRIAYHSKNNNPFEQLSYSIVFEYGDTEGYHAHMFIWYSDVKNPLFKKSDLIKKWNHDNIDIREIKTNIDALLLMFYCYNLYPKYVDGYDFTSNKVKRKRKGLAHFNANEKLTKESNNLIDPVATINDFDEDRLCIISQSCRCNRNGDYYKSFFAIKEDEM